eukprot:CAMPEP_0119007710 /NCGR_PEP_ID=MMETSP1176-20130426/3192_1 /TAXON_ID=265551 /ORGANISM="Synedropsis recta cf, Strain CCMP1620" /LENGTH=815 /DNA_ID=CAMNT_0006959909 /DNA_START=112 /DNA_END=2559 /DNA_ORIENTATION=-
MRFHRLAFAAAIFTVGALTNQSGFALAEEVAADAADAPTAVADDYSPPEGAEAFEFEAEVHKMLDIVVNSLYQNKDVFLRELISNASDAIDKVRFLGLTDGNMLKDKEELEIRIEYDDEANTLTIRDSGVGMTHNDLVQNLGTVARSGTTKFLEALQEQDKNDANVGGMIGKFGVGFYSSFLVADRISVASKHPSEDTQNVWESLNGENSFHIFPDPRGNTLGRGTEITIHLKEDALDYAAPDRLRNLVTHYSEFVTHPIHLRVTNTVEVEVEEDEEEVVETPDEEKKDEDDLEVGDDEVADEEEVEKPKKMETVTTYDWEEINSHVAIWTREKESITDDEYKSFWNVVAKEPGTTCARWNHFNAEGSINFSSILYLPEDVPEHYKFGNIDKVSGGLKLYVRKVLISDEFDLMPRYLGMMRGVVDSDDLPLNVNRETLQESKIIKVIKKKLVRKALDTIRAFAKEEMPEKEVKEVELDEEGNAIEVDDDDEVQEHPYITWYKKFNANLKMGVIDDEANRGKITKLLRFQTSKSGDNWISLDEYLANMQDWQKEIYVIAGASLDEVKRSPFLERFNEKDIEVVYLTDPIDEYMMQQIRDYDGKKLSPITAENVKIEDEDEDMVKRREKAYKKQYKPLTKWLKKLYGPAVMRIAISKRLGTQPAIVSSSEYGHSANMERIMRAQAYQMGKDDFMMRSMKVLEINPRHPFIIKLLEGSPPAKEEEDAEPFVISPDTEDAAWLLLDMGSMNGGFPLNDPEAHSKRMTKYLQSSLGVESLDLEAEIDPPEEDEEAPEMDMDDMMGGMNMDDFDMDSLNLD